jgi:deoxyadenosine/deoxycytidine kinase
VISYCDLFRNINFTNEERWNMIIVDGVVGVGKSTLMNIIAHERKMEAFKEPVVNNPVLEKFYHDRERYSFPLQTFFLNKRFEFIKKASKINNAILDRSIYGDLIFAKMLKDNNEMTTEEYDIYTDLFNNMIEHIPVPDLLIYLDISAENAVKRIKKRGRDFELITEQSYWEKLNNSYTEFFKDYSFSPILKINVNGFDFENNKEHREHVLSVIDKALLYGTK